MTTLTVEANNLTRIYGGREAVSDVSFTLSKGEVLGFLGPNGAGKSTTMKMLTGNLAPSKGSVKICGVDMIENPKEAKALIGYLPETPPLYREFTVDEFLAIGGVAAHAYSLPLRPNRTPPIAQTMSAKAVRIPTPWRSSSSVKEISPIRRV